MQARAKHITYAATEKALVALLESVGSEIGKIGREGRSGVPPVEGGPYC